MTRARVDPDKRQRTAQACESCKRRKQKCSGQQPCNTCEKRKQSCIYTAALSPAEARREAAKRRRRLSHDDDDGPVLIASRGDSVSPTPEGNMRDQDDDEILADADDDIPGTPSASPPNPSIIQKPIRLPTIEAPVAAEDSGGGVMALVARDRANGTSHSRKSGNGGDATRKGKDRDRDRDNRGRDSTNGARVKIDIGSTRPATSVTASHLHVSESEPDGPSHQTATSGPDEEAMLYNAPRMLQDSTGRLLYLGDSATLSYLQLIRMIVESIAGPSAFTLDPRRHRIMENTISLPMHIRPPHILPDRQTADILVESYFTNTNGLLEVFNRKSFVVAMDSCYSDPLAVDSAFLCLLYLVFAIGLVLATPLPGSREFAVIERLRGDHFDRAELFFRSAKCLGDPESGFEDADFWSVQALLLMSVYMLAVSKRNAAYAYYGMAVRSAFALGLHREEAMVIFKPEDLAVRKNLWRSLFILDRFLSASLGRPAAISEEDCSGDVLFTPADGKRPALAPHSTSFSSTGSHVAGLDAAVRSCHVIGDILKKVYSKRRVSTKVAQEIADKCKAWPPKLDPSLYWRHATGAGGIDAAQGVSILHVNLLYCHSVILLTRPFFLYLLSKLQQEKTNTGQSSTRFSPRMEKFSEACVQASCQTIMLVQTAYEGKYLPQRNPFVLYFLFAACLIVLSNEFAQVYYNPSYEVYVTASINMMTYCSETDPQAERLLFILTAFQSVVASRNPQLVGHASRALPSHARLGHASSQDPIANFFAQDHSGAGLPSRTAPHAATTVDTVMSGSSSSAPAVPAPGASTASSIPGQFPLPRPPPPGPLGMSTSGIPPAIARKNSLVSPAIPPNTVAPSMMMHVTPHNLPGGATTSSSPSGPSPQQQQPGGGGVVTPVHNGVSPTLPHAATPSLHASPTMLASGPSTAAQAAAQQAAAGRHGPSSVDHDTGDSQGAVTEGEFDFDTLWQWPAYHGGAGVAGISIEAPPPGSFMSGTRLPGTTPQPIATFPGQPMAGQQQPPDGPNGPAQHLEQQQQHHHHQQQQQQQQQQHHHHNQNHHQMPNHTTAFSVGATGLAATLSVGTGLVGPIGSLQQGNGLSLLNMNVPLYPASDFN